MKDTHKLLPVDSFSGEIGIESKEALIFTSSFLALLKGNLVLFFFFKFILKYRRDRAGERKKREDNFTFYFIPLYWLSLRGIFFFLLRAHALL